MSKSWHGQLIAVKIPWTLNVLDIMWKFLDIKLWGRGKDKFNLDSNNQGIYIRLILIYNFIITN